MFLVKKCLFCFSEFNASLHDHKRGRAVFCSLKCAAKHRSSTRIKPEPNTICALCGVSFYKKASSKTKSSSRSGLFFCSRKHKDQAQRIGGIKDIQPPHYGTISSLRDYRSLALSSLPNECRKCGFKEYVRVLVVHHKDRNRQNNLIDNLEILCPNCHDIEHYLAKDGRFRNLETVINPV